MRNVVTSRLIQVAHELQSSPTCSTAPEARSIIADAIAGGDTSVMWLLLAVVNASLPQREDVRALRRDVAAHGAERAVRRVEKAARRRRWRSGPQPTVKIATGSAIVDVHHTARTRLATGIQRVARMTLREWTRTLDVLPIGWTKDLRGTRELTQGEKSNALYGDQPHAHEHPSHEVIVPWRSQYILLELAIEAPRVERIAALAEFSGNTCSVIGFDCVPLTSSETTGPGMGPAFARNLSAIAHFDSVTAISNAAAREYEGWKSMLASIDVPGPAISAVLLPSEAGTVSDSALADARAELGLTEAPIVLCVGSHEPRKNHGAVVHAADLLWRKGLDFQLVFIGGNAWGERSAYMEMEALVDAGRPLTLVSKPSDELLWCAYALATVSIFPSLNEGFGLPVAESLAMGTPVITSAFGSMAEIASQGGCLLVNPRDDLDIARALERMLTDSALRDDLATQARARDNSSWAEYAQRLWDSLAPKP